MDEAIDFCPFNTGNAFWLQFEYLLKNAEKFLLLFAYELLRVCYK